MRKTLSLSMILAAAIGCSSLALAATAGAGHEWHGHGDRHGAGMGMHELGKLDLNDAQRASIRQMVQQDFAAVKPQMQTLRQQRETFESMSPNAAGYQAATANLAQAEGEAARARVMRQSSLRAQVYGVLTPAQRTQMATLQAQHQAREQQWKAFQAQNPLPQSGQNTQ